MKNRILFKHKDGSTYLSIKNKLVIVYPGISGYHLSQILKKLPKPQREALARLYYRRVREAG